MLVTAGLALAGLLGGCSAAGPAEPDPVPRAEPPAPPAACLLDRAALAATTGLTWTPDQSTATDTRCVYDPSASPGPAGFLAVEVTPSTDDAATQLDTIAQLCERGSRADVDAADGGFTCRYDGGNVYAAMVRENQLVTIASSAVPTGTSGAALARGLTEQLTRIGRP